MPNYGNSKRYHTTKEERINEVISGGSYTNKPINKLTEYLQQDNVKKFNAILTDKSLMQNVSKSAYILNSDELQDEVKEFFTLCYNCQIIPTIQGLATYLGVNRVALYEHSKRDTLNGNILKNCIELCHTNLQNGSISGVINSVLYMFISKNDYGMHDNSTVNLTTSLLDNTTSQNTMNIVKEQLELEQKSQK